MDLSKEERELYDRQIRLWGLEGQSRLRNARILVVGFEAVAVEIVKNLCLAGVGSITLQSSSLVSEEDLAYNFFVGADSLGKNKAAASVVAVQRLNSRVSVTPETQDLTSLGQDYIAGHDVVLITKELEFTQLKMINEAARSNACAFYYCILNGWGGFLFVDLGANPHNFIVERELTEGASSTARVGSVSPSQEIISVKQPDRSAGSNTETLSITETYVSFADAMKCSEKFGKSLKPRQRAKISPYLPAFLALIESPSGVSESAILNKTKALGLPTSIITAEFLQAFNSGRGIQLSSIASVLGGVISQEVINYLTSREYPIQNTHIYDGLNGKGPLYYITS